MLNLQKLTQTRANILLKSVASSETIADATQMYKDKTFQEQNQDKKRFAGIVATIAQVISAILASSFFYFKIALPSLPFQVPYLTQGLAMVLTIVAMVILEYLKKEVLTTLSVSYFKAKSKQTSFKVWLLPFVLCLTVISIYTSFEGAKLFVSQNDKSSLIASSYDATLKDLDAQEQAFKKSISWKGKIDTYNKTNAKVLAGFQDRKNAILSEKSKEVSVHQADIESKGMNTAIFSLIMEILAIGCFFFVAYVNFYIYIESHTAHQEQNQDNQEQEQATKVGFSTVPNSTIAPNNQSNKVGFQFGKTSLEGISPEGISLEGSTKIIQLQANERICKHCSKVFTFKHWNATYCSRECKNIAWEQRTGKKLNFKKGGAK